jgi:hypothetical protein
MRINFKMLESLRLNISMSRLQTIVGLTAGILSITGALSAYLKPAPGKPELAVIVQDAKTQQTVSDATIEILTPRDAVITTLKPNWAGKTSGTLDEGHYRVRVRHPRYAPEVRDVQLISRQNTEVRVQLRAPASPSLGNTVRRLFHH